MITDESIYSITSKITTTPGSSAMFPETPLPKPGFSFRVACRWWAGGDLSA